MAAPIEEFDEIEEFDDEPKPRRIPAPTLDDEIRGAVLDPSYFPEQERQRRIAEMRQEAAPEEIPVSTRILSGLDTGVRQGAATPAKLMYGALDLGLGAAGLGDTELAKWNENLLKQYAERDAEMNRRDIQTFGEDDIANQLASGTGRAAVELPLTIIPGMGAATPAQALTRAAVAGGAVGGGSSYAQDRAEGVGRGEAAAYGALSGTITALTTKAFGNTGDESIFRKEGIKGIRNRIISAAKDVGLEMSEEAADQVQQDLLERGTRNPEKSLDDSLKETLMAAAVGGILGGGVTAARGAMDLTRNEPTTPEKVVPSASPQIAAAAAEFNRRREGITAEPQIELIEEFDEPMEVSAADPATGNLLEEESRTNETRPSIIPPTGDGGALPDGAKATAVGEVEPTEPSPTISGGESDPSLRLGEAIKETPEPLEISNASPDQILEWKRRVKYGPETSRKIAEKLTDADVQKLVEARDAARQEARDDLSRITDPTDNAAISAANTKSLKAQTLNEIIQDYQSKPLSGDEIGKMLGAEFRGEAGKGGTLLQFEAKKPDGSASTSFSVKKGATREQVLQKYKEVQERYKDDPENAPRNIPDAETKAALRTTEPQRFDLTETAIHQDVVAEVAKMQKQFPGGREVIVVDGYQKLPDSAHVTAYKQGGHPSQISGAVVGDKVYINSANIGSIAEARQIWLHEQAGHFATDRILGKKMRGFMEQVHKSFAKSDGMADVRSRYKNDKGALTQQQYNTLLGREFVAMLAENPKADPTAWNKIVAQFRTWLRDIGWVKEVSENDIRVLLARATESMKQKAAGVSTEASLSLKPQEESAESVALDPATGSPISSIQGLLEKADARMAQLDEEKARASKPPEAEPEIVGMGGATPSEFGSPVPYVTSNKNAKVDEERKARGLPPMMETARQSNQAAWDEAMRIVDETPDVQDRLIEELTASPRALTPVENAMVMHRRIFLRNEYEKALHRWRDMFEFGDLTRAADESQRVKDFSSQLADLEDITKATGAESGRSLQARKMMANEDYSLAAMELAALEAKGRNLTPQEHLELIRANEKISALERKLAEYEAGREEREVATETTAAMKEVESTAKAEAKSKDFDIDREEKLVGGIKAKIDSGKLNEITPLVQQLARVFWRRGVRGREPMIDALHATLKTIIPEFTRDDTQRAFSGYGNFTPLSKAEIDVGLRDLRGQTQQVLKLEALEARKPLEKTGQERRVPSDEERRLIKQVNELKRKYGVVVTDPATQLKSALQSRKTYYEHRISDLKHEIATRERIVKTKSPSPTDPELDALRAEHDRLKAEHDSIFPKREITDEQRLKLAIAAAERNQAQWESRLENAEKGIFGVTRKGKKEVTSAELENIKAQTQAIKEHVQELKLLANPKKTKEEIALQSLKTRMQTRMAELRDRMARGDFTKKERKPVTLDAEGNRLKAELDAVKEEFDTRLEQDRWAKMSVFDKTKRKIADTYDAARALMTTGELSFILRQAKMPTLSRPIQTAKALPDMFRALVGSEQRAREIDMAVHNHPDAPAARAAKLAIIEEGVSLHKQEELKMGRWVGNIPIVKNFNRAAQVFLNRIRFDTWQAMRKSMSKSGTPTPEEDKQIAMFVNEATGRGGLGKLEPAAVPLARVMFSPRYYASRLQLAAGHSLWGGTGRTRRIIATEYARSLIGLGLYYTMLYAYFSRGDDEDKEKGSIETDPRSTDFGKVKIGKTRLDPLAGLSQVVVLAARTVTGEKKTSKGKIVPIRGKDVALGGDKWTDIVKRHIQGKLHPVPSSIANLFDGTDLGGDEATLINQSQNLIAPITYVDIYTALKEQDLPDGVALALLALLGEGVQTYEKKK